MRYCKNPSEFLSNTVDASGEPLHPSDVACAVLYSGDFQSAKKEQLNGVVQDILIKQKELPFPASIAFVPDA